jgi:pyruvate dehydrogenase E1 component
MNPSDITPSALSAAFWRVIPADADPLETREWLDGFQTLVQHAGTERGTYLLRRLFDEARRLRVSLPAVLNAP